MVPDTPSPVIDDTGVGVARYWAESVVVGTPLRAWWLAVAPDGYWEAEEGVV